MKLNAMTVTEKVVRNVICVGVKDERSVRCVLGRDESNVPVAGVRDMIPGGTGVPGVMGLVMKNASLVMEQDM